MTGDLTRSGDGTPDPDSLGGMNGDEGRAFGPVVPRFSVREMKAAETRRRLLTTARELMSQGGAAGVSIGALAAGAGIAVGTFYSYFPSRDEIIDAVIYDEVETMARRLDSISAAEDDPVIAYSNALRHLVRTAISDPVWGWFLVRAGMAHEGLVSILGPRIRDYLRRGIEAGRFHIADPDLASAMTLGSLLSAMPVFLKSGESPDDAASTFTASLLRMLGIGLDEAAQLAEHVLPPLPAGTSVVQNTRIPL